MELELGLAPPTAHLDLSCSSDSSSSGSGKRRAFQETLPLFDDGSKKKKPQQQLVGWPPVSSSALRTRACAANNSYVKVRMEGEAIGRKVDLSVLASYDDLVAALGRMFPATANNQSGTVLTCKP
jgi:auxin-responsive protein IAA